MPYEVPIVTRNRCCPSDCDPSNPEAPSCWEVYLPGTDPDEDLPYRWYIDANVWDTIDGRMYDAVGRQHQYQSDHADCFPCSEGTDPVENIVGLRAIRFLKVSDCGPIRVSWMYGNGTGQGCGGDDDADHYTYIDETTQRLILPGELGDTVLVPCRTPYLAAESPPTCLYVSGVILDEISVQNGGPCGDVDEPHNDKFGALQDSTGTKTITWAIDANQVNITVTYMDGVSTYTNTFPFVRNWWLEVLDLWDVSENLVNVYECSEVPCDPYLCFPLCVVNTCPDDPETINASAVFVTASDGVDEYTGTATWSDVTNSFAFSFPSGPCGNMEGKIYCDLTAIKVDFGSPVVTATYTVDWTCVDGDVSWTTETEVFLPGGCAFYVTLWTNNSGAG